MSIESEKVIGIKQLPLFPLSLVLLPNELIPLHIFEPRYRQMFSDIALEKNIFGMTFFEPEENFLDKPAPGTIGCAAEVREVQPMEDGRSNIIAVGLLRFQLIGYIDTDAPYLIGEVEFFDDEPESKSVTEPLADEVFELFRRIAKAAHKLSGDRGRFPEIPKAEPQALSFLVTAAFNLEPEIKYELLEIRLTSKRLIRLKEILVRTVDKMEESAEINKIARTNGHSKKKLDL